MAYGFIEDLDGFFCETYERYETICALRGYRMPQMQKSDVDELGFVRTYTLPAERKKLCHQEDKTELLKQLKGNLRDLSFSFSFEPIGWFTRLQNVFKKNVFYKFLKTVWQRHGIAQAEAGAELSVSSEIWNGICEGRFLPSKNLIFSLAVVVGLSMEDTKKMLSLCGYAFDYTEAKDVVISYLVQQKVHNREMVNAALKEYKIENLFLKEA
ncbi:MAG: hypothetical protein IJV85_00845 [Clostridia bacterium]|nr:hypothetical protein [Clostridia bacterium]